MKVIALEAEDHTETLRDAPAGDVSGGRIYDAIIAACARTENARTLLTFNDSQFRSLAGPDLAIVVP